jgi:magnesium transporter
MLSATISGAIISRYEEALQSIVALTVFIPMLMDTGGNAGSQSATLVIRSLALGETRPKDVLQVIWKELGVSILVAIPLTIVNFLRIHYLQGYSVSLSVTVASTLFVTILSAKLIGGTLPILAERLLIDPEIMASPLITTIVDAITLICYFRFAVWLLGV